LPPLDGQECFTAEWELLERFRLRRSTIAAVAGGGGAFVRCEEVERESDEAADLVEGARPGGAQEGVQVGERELDRIEVRTIGREEAHERPHGLDRPASSRTRTRRTVKPRETALMVIGSSRPPRQPIVAANPLRLRITPSLTAAGRVRQRRITVARSCAVLPEGRDR